MNRNAVQSPDRRPWRLVLAGLVVALGVIVPFILFGAPIEAWTGRFIDVHAGRPATLKCEESENRTNS